MRGQNDPHRKLKHHQNGKTCPVISMDFGFMKRHGDAQTMPSSS